MLAIRGVFPAKAGKEISGLIFFVFIAGLFDAETISVGPRDTLGDKSDPVSGHDQVLQAKDGIIAENSFDFIDGKIQFLGD